MGRGAGGTFARPPLGVAARYNKTFVHRKMESKGWVTDYTRSSYQGFTMDEVAPFLVDLKQMIPLNAQGSWPTKTMVSLWFKSDTNLATMIELLLVVKDELNKEPCKLHEQLVKARLEITPTRNPWRRRTPCFHKGLSAARADESKINVICDKLHISVLIGRNWGAKFTPEGEGLADQGWIINHDIIGAICAVQSEALV